MAVTLAIGAILFLLTPAAASSLVGGWPLTTAGTLAFAAAVGVLVLAWRTPAAKSAHTGWIAAAFFALIVLRVAAAAGSVEPGWLARYYSNDAWQGAPEWSSEYRRDDATRVDRALSFAPGQFPVHYLNGPRFSDAAPDRDIALPMSVQWSGVFDLASREAVVVDARGNGSWSLSLDGSPVSAETTLDAGRHAVEVKYLKPAGVAGAVQVDLRRAAGGSRIEVFPPGSPATRRPLLDAIAIGADVFMLLLLIAAAVSAASQAWRSEKRLQLGLATLLVIGLGAQGFVSALSFRNYYTLTAGDDWLGFESRAREILQHGLLMPLGAAIGEGVPYFYHPFYPYVLAGIHALSGESLLGPIFAHFLLLAATAIVVFSIARQLFGVTPAIIGVAALIVIFEVDFIRYYTITLLSENLYVFTVSCCLAAFARWAESGRTAWLVQAGVWGGVSAATRPVMMVFLPFAVAVAWLIARLRQSPGALRAPLVLVAAWMACVLPFTIRNWIVAKQFVLISSGQGGAVIAHNVPPSLDAEPYLAAYRSGGESSVAVLWRILVEHPGAVIALQIKKIGFTLGMIQWFEGYRPHPELVAVSVLYIAMLVLSRTMRRPELWPVHAFVFSHWGSMLLTSPWNYGYRLILPAYVYTTALSVAAAAAMPALRPAHR